MSHTTSITDTGKVVGNNQGGVVKVFFKKQVNERFGKTWRVWEEELEHERVTETDLWKALS